MLDLPDEAIAVADAVAKRESRSLANVIADLVLGRTAALSKMPAIKAAETQWLEEWFCAADAAMASAPAGPTAREWLQEDRNRLAKP